MGHDTYYTVQDTPIPSHPGAVGARAWIEKRSTTLVQMPPAGEYTGYNPPILSFPPSNRTDVVTAGRFLLAVLSNCAIGGFLILIGNHLDRLGNNPAPLIILLLTIALGGFATALMLRVNTTVTGGRAIGMAIVTGLVTNIVLVGGGYLYYRLFGTHKMYLGAFPLFLWLIFFAFQIPILVLGATLGIVVTPRRYRTGR